MTTIGQTDEEQDARASLTPQNAPASAPSSKNTRFEITPETDLNQLAHCNVRRKRIEVLVEFGRRILEEFPNTPPQVLARMLFQKAMDLWEVQTRTAKGYLRRVMPRMEEMRASSSRFRPVPSQQAEDYARTRDYVELLRQSSTHDGQEES
jgi:hypothetical protein